MKRTQKRTLGFLSLSLVAATTLFAAFLPDPNAGAVSSVTDTIQVQVINNKPAIRPDVGRDEESELEPNSTIINVVQPSSSLSGAIVTNSKQEISFSYSSVGEVTITIYYTDKNGVTHESVYDRFDANYVPGEYKKTIDLSEGDYDYGDYVIKITGIGADGVPGEAVIAFSYYPLNANITKNNTTGITNLNINYDRNRVAKIKINIYDNEGNLLIPPSPIYDSSLDGSGRISMELLLSEYGLADGRYTIEFIAYDKYGLMLYKPITLQMNYSTTEVPKTSGSKLFYCYDYLMIGLVIFLALGILFLLMVSRRKREEQ